MVITTEQYNQHAPHKQQMTLICKLLVCHIVGAKLHRKHWKEKQVGLMRKRGASQHYSAYGWWLLPHQHQGLIIRKEVVRSELHVSELQSFRLFYLEEPLCWHTAGEGPLGLGVVGAPQGPQERSSPARPCPTAPAGQQGRPGGNQLQAKVQITGQVHGDDTGPKSRQGVKTWVRVQDKRTHGCDEAEDQQALKLKWGSSTLGRIWEKPVWATGTSISPRALDKCG